MSGQKKPCMLDLCLYYTMYVMYVQQQGLLGLFPGVFFIFRLSSIGLDLEKITSIEFPSGAQIWCTSWNFQVPTWNKFCCKGGIRAGGGELHRATFFLEWKLI